METKLKIAHADEAYEKVSLIKPAESGYIHIAAEVDRRLPFLPASRSKNALLSDCKGLCKALERRADVRSAKVFKALRSQFFTV